MEVHAMASHAWISVIPENRASGRLAELYHQELDPRHQVVDNILKVHSLRPQSLADHAAMYHTTMHAQSGLTRAEREMIAVVVSSINECGY
jgi:alkylhydroperoxidase family enzyme